MVRFLLYVVCNFFCMEKDKGKIIQEVMKMDADLRRYAATLAPNREDQEDLIQNTYLKVMQYSDQFRSETNLKAWVFTIMRNTYLNDYRRSQRGLVVSEKFVPQGYENFRHNPADDADLHFFVKDINGRIMAKSPDQRKPFEMFVDGYKYQEIADAMVLSIGTVKSRIYFMRKKLMEELRDYVTPTFPRTA